MVCFYKELFSDKVVCQSLTGPCGGKGLFFNLGISPFGGVSARDMNTTGFHFPSICFWVRTAPRPYEDASADRIVSSAGSKIARAGAELNFSFTTPNACCWGGPQTQAFFLLRSSLSGWVSSARFGMYLPD